MDLHNYYQSYAEKCYNLEIIEPFFCRNWKCFRTFVAKIPVMLREAITQKYS